MRPGAGPLGVRKRRRHRHPTPDPHAGDPVASGEMAAPPAKRVFSAHPKSVLTPPWQARGEREGGGESAPRASGAISPERAGPERASRGGVSLAWPHTNSEGPRRGTSLLGRTRRRVGGLGSRPSPSDRSWPAGQERDASTQWKTRNGTPHPPGKTKASRSGKRERPAPLHGQNAGLRGERSKWVRGEAQEEAASALLVHSLRADCLFRDAGVCGSLTRGGGGRGARGAARCHQARQAGREAHAHRGPGGRARGAPPRPPAGAARQARRRGVLQPPARPRPRRRGGGRVRPPDLAAGAEHPALRVRQRAPVAAAPSSRTVADRVGDPVRRRGNRRDNDAPRRGNGHGPDPAPALIAGRAARARPGARVSAGASGRRAPGRDPRRACPRKQSSRSPRTTRLPPRRASWSERWGASTGS